MNRSWAKLSLAALIAMAVSLGEPGVRESQVAEAADWKFYAGSVESYCEGCCEPNYLCCQVDSPCRIYVEQ
jgi:hypothetical protein